MEINYCCSIRNIYREDWVVESAKHEFIMGNAIVLNAWREALRNVHDYSEEFKRVSDEFDKRIEVTKAIPIAAAVNGVYRVTSVTVFMRFRT